MCSMIPNLGGGDGDRTPSGQSHRDMDEGGKILALSATSDGY